MSQQDLPPGSARLQLADGIAVLRPEASVFEAMVTGWSHQQLARNLSAGTVSGAGGHDTAVLELLRCRRPLDLDGDDGR